jgi:hypothetical protein
MEKPSSKRKRLTLAGVVLGLALAVALLVTGRPDRAAAPVDRPAVPTVVGPVAAGPGAPPLVLAAVRPKLPLMPEEQVAEILKKDKQLGLFMDYHKTVLLDAPRRAEYRKLLASPEMMKAMADGLMDPGSGKVAPEEYYHRLMRVDYFEAALSWKDNPARDQVLSVTADIIAKDNFERGQDSARRQLLGGSKMELYRLMYEQDSAKASGLVAQAKGTRMEPLVSWMAAEELRRRVREAEIHEELQEQQAKAN